MEDVTSLELYLLLFQPLLVLDKGSREQEGMTQRKWAEADLNSGPTAFGHMDCLLSQVNCSGIPESVI